MIVTQTTSALDRVTSSFGPGREGGVGEGSGSALRHHISLGRDDTPGVPSQAQGGAGAIRLRLLTTQAWDGASPPPSSHRPKSGAGAIRLRSFLSLGAIN